MGTNAKEIEALLTRFESKNDADSKAAFTELARITLTNLDRLADSAERIANHLTKGKAGR